MSLYNMLFGKNPAYLILLKCLGYSESDIPRFRDCFVNDNKIIIHTRTGGGNRDYYDSPEAFERNKYDPEDIRSGPWNSDLRKHPNYLNDEDDDFDCTYANFYFSFPDEHKAELEALSNQLEDFTPSEKWKIAFNGLGEKKES